jgi:hypothetical protein
MERYAIIASEKEPDEMTNRFYRNDTGAVVMAEKQRVVFD